MHPRTLAHLEAGGGDARLRDAGVHVSAPLGYHDFLGLEAEARARATDSGGVQEETSALGVRCFTLRDSTERPVTVTHGTNTADGRRTGQARGDPDASRTSPPRARPIPLWDGKAGKRAAEVLRRTLA